MFPIRFLPLVVLWLAVSAGGLGCGGSAEGPAKEAPGNYQHLMAIRTAYVKAAKALNRPPQSAKDLMPYLKKFADPAAILRSPDDGQEYKIFWGVDLPNAESTILAYEQQGKGGKRYVLAGRNIRQLTDEEFKKATFPPGQKAPL